jgi:serine phosphatase RsbU (regulator of sigma subunit)
MFLEYRLLRQTILEVLDETRSLLPEERELITDALERAMPDAVGGFAMVHQSAERERGDEARRMAEELRIAYERERRIAQVLQRPLLLNVNEDAAPGLSVATVYEPAWLEAEVGGDFFDVFTLPDGRAALAVGDTCGKGLEAAARNTHVKEVLRAFLREDPGQPARVMGRLNGVVCDILEGEDPMHSGRFVVLSLLVVDGGSGAAVHTSAGAEPLLVLRAGDEAETVHRPALPLGVERAEQYEQTQLHLARGDTALLVTDGITEARAAGQTLGYEGMAQLARAALGASSVQETAQSILDGARGFAQGVLRDDACMIVVQRR